MFEIHVKGHIQADGSIIIDDKVALPAGEVELIIRPQSQHIGLKSVSLAEAEMILKNLPELSPAQLAETERIYTEMGQGQPLDLPDDFLDELDHYLYDSPRRDDEAKT